MRRDPPAGPHDADDPPRQVATTGNGHRPPDPLEPGPLEEAPLDARVVPEGPPPSPPSGPPGSAVFSIEGRPAPGLYVVAWALSLLGVVVLFVALQTAPSLARGVLLLAGLAVITGGMALGAGYQVVARRSRPSVAYRGPSPLLLFAISLTISTAIGILLFGIGSIDTDAPAGFLAAVTVVQATYILVIVVFVRRTGVLRWNDMGWPVGTRAILRHVLSDAGYAIAVMVPSTLVVLLFAGFVGSLLDVQPPSVLPGASSSGDALALVLAAVFIAPIGEELFFRGFALTAWHRDLGPRRALVRSALFFAIVHVGNVDATNFSQGARQALLEFVVILPLGFVLGWLFQRRGILASIAGHCTYNGFLLVLVFVAQRLVPSG